MTTNRPLVYFASNTDYTREYTNDNPINKQAVFVGDTKKIYTHGVEFDGNNTTYGQATSDDLGLIKIGYTQNEKNYPVQLDSNGKAYVNVNWSDTDTIYDDSEIRQDIVDVEGFLEDLRGDLEGIHNWTADEVQDQVKSLLNDADWLNGWIEAHNIQTGKPFTFSDFQDDLGQYLIGIGVLEEYDDNGETKTRLGWSQLQASYDSLALSVQQLEQGGVDEEALKAELKQYIDNDTAVAQLETMYSKVNENGEAIDWMISGLKALAGENETFVNLWSASQDAISGLTTRVQTLENGDYITTTSIGSYAPSLDAFSGLSSRVQTVEGNVNAMADFGSRIGSVESGLQTVTSTANGNSTAIANLFATNGTGTAAISTYVNTWWSGVTISADKVNLTGKQLDMMFEDNSQNASKLFKVNTNNSTLTVHNSESLKDFYTTITPKEISVNYYDLDGDHMTDDSIIIHDDYIKFWQFEDTDNGTSLYITDKGMFEASSAKPDTLPDFYVGEFDANNDGNDKYVLKVDDIYADNINTDVLEVGSGVVQIHKASNYDNASDIWIENGDIAGIRDMSVGGTLSVTGASTLEATTFNGAVTANSAVTINNRVDIPNNELKLTKRPYTNEPLHTTSISGMGISMYVEGQAQNQVYIDSGGAITVSGNMYATSFQQTSDRNLKDIVSDTTLTVEQVANAPAVNFTWKKDAEDENKKQNVGTIAQYWQVVLPEVVGEAEDGTLTMQYSNAAMISAIATAKEVVALKQEIAELKSQIAELIANK